VAEYYIGEAVEIPEGARRIVQINGREIGVFNIRGQYYALPNVCFHQRGPLCAGRVTGTLVADAETGWIPRWVNEGEILRCPWHSMEFNITTGQCLAFPKRRIQAYQLKVEAGRIFLVL
jgi:nitrite reductase/ring-hydroxylating ferredoxin subunit